MECHKLKTFYWHYKTYVYTTTTQHTVVATFQFFDDDDVELNQKGQQYILVQNDLNTCIKLCSKLWLK